MFKETKMRTWLEPYQVEVGMLIINPAQIVDTIQNEATWDGFYYDDMKDEFRARCYVKVIMITKNESHPWWANGYRVLRGVTATGRNVSFLTCIPLRLSRDST